MDFRALLSNLSWTEFESLAENWFSRLNRLKAKYHELIRSQTNPEKATKCHALISEMVGRKLVVTYIYSRAIQPKRPGNNKPSGFKDPGNGNEFKITESLAIGMIKPEVIGYSVKRDYADREIAEAIKSVRRALRKLRKNGLKT